VETAPPVILITGGSSGIGAATAVAFARLSARVAIVDVQMDRAATVVEQVRSAGGEALPLSADVRDPEALHQAVGAALERFGRIDALVANAGISDQSSSAAGDPARWRAVVDTNVLGVLYSVRAVLPTMLERRRGHLFILASVSGRETYVGEPVYIASKWAQVGFGHALRQEVAASGIRVTLVEPGIVDTPLTRDNPVVRPLLDAAEPLVPDDVARAIVYAYEQPEHVAVSELTLRPLRHGLPSFGPDVDTAGSS
jgi:NADP-dependent 3-hydroxy acid dehydrogenase YdfG